MLSYEDLASKAAQLDQQINESLIRKEFLNTQETVAKSKASYQRSAYLKKLHEKLNIVILSRNKAQEANNRLLSDFDRIQKHLSLMDSKTEALMSKVKSQKEFLDANYPNWREKANMFVSPSYISQENMFNMLDSLRCRLNNTDSISFQNFPVNGKLNLSSDQSLAGLLVNKRDRCEEPDQQFSTRKNEAINGENIEKSRQAKEPQLEKNSTQPFIGISSKRPSTANSFVNIEKTDTLTNITESVDIPANMKTSVMSAPTTEEAISPRQSLDFTPETTTEETSFVDPLQNANQFSFKYQSAVKQEEELDTDFSEGNIESMLSPVKKAPSTPIHSPKEHPRPSSREKIIDSPAGSVDTVIKSPPEFKKAKSAVKLSTSINQVNLFIANHDVICVR